ncbi:hypothetical protein [Williamsia sp. CHRR-6]|uniref:LppU/SCO3897 family protein n=1 Tax=Williamsia sp. CHRR-6 TaxID=2835871 RepID=UPI001BD9D7D3|nr:hypothetical protein [Williamsia sp. CHRR-6]MBT0566384.1 hypothetical protein [Williamsia sp. CHRR-6]
MTYPNDPARPDPDHPAPQFGFPPPFPQPGHGPSPYPAPPPAGGPPPYGQSPYPPAPGAPGPYPPPPLGTPLPKKRKLWPLLVILGVVAAVVVGSVIAVVALTKDNVTAADDVNVKDCVTVKPVGDKVKPEKVSCSSSTFSYTVAEKFESSSASCTDTLASAVTFGDRGRLCLRLNLQVGKCYRLPTGADKGDFGRIDEVSCGAASAGSLVIEVKSRSRASEDCGGSEPLTFTKPDPLTYCVDAISGG